MRSETIVKILAATLAAAGLSGCTQSPQTKSARYIEAGKKEMAKKDTRRAILDFRNAVQANPKNAEAIFQLAQAYIASGDIRSAAGMLRKTLEVDPKHRQAQLVLAELMSYSLDSSQLKDAQQQLRNVLAQSPDNPDALHALAFTELKLNETDDAVAHLERAMSAAPQQVVIAATLASAKMQQKDVAGAEAVLKKAAANSPKSGEAAVLLGRFYTLENRPPEAVREYQHALELDHANSAAFSELAGLKLRMGQKAEAEQILTRMSALPDKTINFMYAIFLFQESRQPEAIREFERLAKQDPENRDARTRLVAAYQAANRPTDGMRILDNVLKKNPQDDEALLQRGEMFLAMRKYNEADADLNRVLHLNPQSAAAHYVIAKVNQARGSSLSYREELSKSLQLNPYLIRVRAELAQLFTLDNKPSEALSVIDGAPDYQKQSTLLLTQRNWALWANGDMANMRKGIDAGLAQERSADFLVQDGLWKLRAGNPASARSSLEEALKINPTELALRGLGQSYIAQKNRSTAIQKVREYAAQQPRSAPIQEFLGELLLGDHDEQGARAAFAAAKTADPHFIQADLSLVRVDMLDHNFKSARQRITILVEANPSNALPRLWEGVLDQLNGDNRAAIANLRKVLELNPNESQALNNLAYLLSENGGNIDEALKFAQEAVEQAPDRADYADTLGWILYQKGVYSSAIQYLQKGTSDPKIVVAKYHLAMAYAKAGDRKHGETVLAAALEANPELPEAKLARAVVDASH